MAPKKNNNSAPNLAKKTTGKKAPKQKIKKEKVIKVKTLNVNSKLNKNGKSMSLKKVKKNVETPKLKRNQLSAQAKIELANEVAREQLVRKKPAKTNDENKSPVAATEPVLQRKRKKKPVPQNIPTETTDTNTLSSPTDSEEAFDMTPKKKKYARKVPLTNVAAEKKPVLIRKGKATEKKTSEPKKNLVQTAIMDLKIETDKITKNSLLGAKKPVKKSVSKPRSRRQTTQRGKLYTNNMSSNGEQNLPSLLDGLENMSPQKDTFVEHESPSKENIEAGNIMSRKTSMTGTSDLSWTKDISSSSTTTCVTVCSTDFVRIDNKMPILKLTNIDAAVMPKNSQNLSFESESNSSSESTSKSSERKSSADLDTRSLNLSMSSVIPTESRETQVNSEKNYDKRVNSIAVDRITANLKKIDLEIMNWIGYDNTDLNIQVKQFQEKIFRVLKEESEVIAHCQSLKRVFSDLDASPNHLNEKTSNNSNEKTSDSLNVHSANNLNENTPNDVTENTPNNVNKKTNDLNDNTSNNIKEKTRNNLNGKSPNHLNEKTLINLNENTPNNLNVNGLREKYPLENNFAVPVSSSKVVEREIPNISNDHNREFFSPPKDVNNESEDSENNFTSNNCKYTSFEQNYDDDDALSLFAESITGMESSRVNTSITSNENTGVDHLEEYIPQPVSKEKWETASKISYVPSKIVNDGPTQDNRRTICEKHNADSTSRTKDTGQGKNDVPESIPNFLDATTSIDNTDSSQQNKCVAIGMRKMPCLMSFQYKSLHGNKSLIFRNVCFYNLISCCKLKRCRYPHVFPDPKDIQAQLVRLNEELLIKEYMLLRNWPILRRAFGMCFVEECKRRELTRILVEMAIDCMKANDHYSEDAHLKVIVSECTLLYLNAVDLSTCEDLLLFDVQKGVLLCDIFMKTIADTQNFSRFKHVFINLTQFIVDHDRTFNFNVATQILERVCILPCEYPLTEALFQIVRHTDQTIFENTMMGTFEKQLSILAQDLYEQFLVLKKKASLNRPVLKNLFVMSPRMNQEGEPVNTSLAHTEREKRYTSPDTTDLDNMKKSTAEPVVIPTIDFNRVRQMNIQRSLSNSNSSNDSVEQARPAVEPMPRPMYRKWRGRLVLDKFGQRPLETFLSPSNKRRIHRMPNQGPSRMFHRRSVPDFY